MLETGDKLPKFKLPDQSGEAKAFKDLVGPKGLILFVYSRDNTSGCTVEAAEFQAQLKGIQAKGYGVAGLSRDSAASHQKFAAKLGLDYPLLADPETGLIQALGAWGEKKMYGKVSQGPVRSTFVTNQSGKLIMFYPKVKAKGHAAAVTAELA
jgi:thioredoxin-dependent peroxiredoxin